MLLLSLNSLAVIHKIHPSHVTAIKPGDMDRNGLCASQISIWLLKHVVSLSISFYAYIYNNTYAMSLEITDHHYLYYFQPELGITILMIQA